MSGKLTLMYRDFDGDTKQASYTVASPLADGSDYDTWQTNLDNLKLAIEVLSAGLLNSETRSSNYEIISNSKSNTPIAQANIRAICQYQDTVTLKTYQDIVIPMPHLGLADTWRVQGGLTVLDLASTNGGNFRDVFEDYVISADGNSVVLEQVYIEE